MGTRKFDMSKMRQENIEQAKALAAMHGDVMELIDKYAQELRNIINDFEEEFGHCPKACDLIWIASQHAGRDLTKPA